MQPLQHDQGAGRDPCLIRAMTDKTGNMPPLPDGSLTIVARGSKQDGEGD